MMDISDSQDSCKDTPLQGGVADMAPLIRRLREFQAPLTALSISREAPFDHSSLARRFGFMKEKGGKPNIILSKDVAVELGHPGTASHAIVLTTFKKENINPGTITVIGPEIAELRQDEKNPFAQIILIAVDQADIPDPFQVSNGQYLMNRLPGYMVRSLPGRLWVRISRQAMASGMSLQIVGSALINAYQQDFPNIHAIEILFITSGQKEIEALDGIRTEADILSGRHKKLALGIDGEVECAELECDVCDEKPVCDNLKDVVIKRRKEKNSRKKQGA